MSWNTYQLAVFIALVSITVFFGALVFAYAAIMPRDASGVRFPLPLWFSTACLLASSVVYERARWALRRAQLGIYSFYLNAAIVTGVAFVALQFIAWLDLWRQGVYVQANPRGSVFFMFTGLHAAHLAGGLAALLWLRRKAKSLRPDLEEHPLRRYRTIVNAAALYWHFMGVLWLVLFLILLLLSGN